MICAHEIVERNSMSSFFGRRALVVGSGIGGLSAAGALADYFEQVDILERDRIPAFAESRPGTPQDRHPHFLLAGGLKALGEIFPGFERDLAKAGAVSVKIAQEFRLERPDVGALPGRDLGLSILCASRPLIESVLRRRVMALGNVALQPKHRVTEIFGDARAVRGVRFDSVSGHSNALDADLVVDASGRGGLSLALLDALGRERPEVTEVGTDLAYATAVVPIPEQALDWKAVGTLPDAPASALGAVLVPIEGDRWIVAIADRRGPARIETWDSFLATLQRLTTSTIFDALRHVKPSEGVIRHHGFSISQWKHFERMSGLPRGLLPIADAVCRFNPMRGQGMSSAARQARLLQTVLQAAATKADPIAAAQGGFMADVESVLQTPWAMSTGADLAYPDIRGERPKDFEKSRQFEAALFRAAVADPVVHRAVVEVSQLLQPHDLLHEPHIMERVETFVASAEAAA
jgi:2-polyprenyl-6-methoxyphenol hydroxylase-like FAD-dependent oxidoreductase